MPRSRSTFIQSLRARRRSPRALTAPASWIAPPKSSSFSVNVVLPASGCAMIANVRRRAIWDGKSATMGAVYSTDAGSATLDAVVVAVAALARACHARAVGRRRRPPVLAAVAEAAPGLGRDPAGGRRPPVLRAVAEAAPGLDRRAVGVGRAPPVGRAVAEAAPGVDGVAVGRRAPAVLAA